MLQASNPLSPTPWQPMKFRVKDVKLPGIALLMEINASSPMEEILSKSTRKSSKPPNSKVAHDRVSRRPRARLTASPCRDGFVRLYKGLDTLELSDSPPQISPRFNPAPPPHTWRKSDAAKRSIRQALAIAKAQSQLLQSGGQSTS